MIDMTPSGKWMDRMMNQPAPNFLIVVIWKIYIRYDNWRFRRYYKRYVAYVKSLSEGVR